MVGSVSDVLGERSCSEGLDVSHWIWCIILSFCVRFRLWIVDTLVSKKFTDVSLMSTVNLIVSWKEFKASMKESNSSRECCHTMNMLSI